MLEELKNLYPEEFCESMDFNLIEKAIKGDKLSAVEIKKLKKITEERIDFEKSKLENSDLNRIKNYIFFLSLSNIKEFETHIWEKSLSLFTEIKNVFVLTTSSSQKRVSELKLPKNIILNQVYIDDNNYEGVYDHLKNIILDNELEREETVIDNTLGFKMTSAVFYRFSVEQNIKLITWQTQQKNIDGRLIRVPGTDSFHYLKSPNLKNLKNYKLLNNINELIKAYKFKEASYLCYSISNDDRAHLLEKLSLLFSLDSIQSKRIFLKAVDRFIEDKNLGKVQDLEIRDISQSIVWALNNFKNDTQENQITRYYIYTFSLVLNSLGSRDFSQFVIEKIFENSKDMNFEVIDNIFVELFKNDEEESGNEGEKIIDNNIELHNIQVAIEKHTKSPIKVGRERIIFSEKEIEFQKMIFDMKGEKSEDETFEKHLKREEIIERKKYDKLVRDSEVFDIVESLIVPTEICFSKSSLHRGIKAILSVA